MIKIGIKVADNKQKCEWKNDKCYALLVYVVKFDDWDEKVLCDYHIRSKVNDIVGAGMYDAQEEHKLKKKEKEKQEIMFKIKIKVVDKKTCWKKSRWCDGTIFDGKDNYNLFILCQYHLLERIETVIDEYKHNEKDQ